MHGCLPQSWRYVVRLRKGIRNMSPKVGETQPLEDINTTAGLLLTLFEKSSRKEPLTHVEESLFLANLRNKIRERVTDHVKQKLIDELSYEELQAVTTPKPSSEISAIVNSKKELRALRDIFTKKLTDWGSKNANNTKKTIKDFIKSDFFQPYPQFLKSDMLKLVKQSTIKLYRMNLKDLKPYELIIQGAKFNNNDNEVEVLVTYNQTMASGNSKNDIFNFSQRELNIPPQAVVGLLKKTDNGLVVQVLSPFFNESRERLTFEILLEQNPITSN